LKGDSSLYEDVENEPSFMNQDGDLNEDEDMFQGHPDEPNFLDQEFPPEGLMSDDVHEEEAFEEEIMTAPTMVPKASSPKVQQQQQPRSSMRIKQQKKAILGKMNYSLASEEKTESSLVETKTVVQKTFEDDQQQPTSARMEELIKLHRQHIRENTDFGKLESKILVNLTMKMKGTFDEETEAIYKNYTQELKKIMEKKMESISEMMNLLN
jgi:hypothetical protein